MKNLEKSISDLFLFLETSKTKVPTRESKAEFKFYFEEFQKSVSEVQDEKDHLLVLDSLKEKFSKKDQEIYKAYTVYSKMYFADEENKKFKIEIN